MKKTQTQWSNEYNAKAYDRLAVQVKKGRREEIRSHAQARGESLNGFINRAIDETMKRDVETRSNSDVAFEENEP